MARELKPRQGITAVPAERDIRYGTGLTKKLIESAQKRAEMDEEAALSLMAKKRQELDLNRLNDPTLPPLITIPEKTIQYDTYQLKAIAAALIERHLCIIGAAGSGKTTSLKAVINAILDHIPIIKDIKEDGTELERYAIGMCSYTGRATQIIKRAMPEKFHPNIMTGHKLLDYAPEIEEWLDEKVGEWKEKKIFKPRFNIYRKFGYVIIVIDEASMFPVKLFNELVAAAPDNVRFIFVGDINQLPPVMDRPILPYAMMEYETIELKEIHRQALESPIIAASQEILHGRMPKKNPNGFFMQSISDGSLEAETQVLKMIRALTKAGKFDPMLDAIIVPTNINSMGQENLNADLMMFFNPPKYDANGVNFNHRFAIKARMGTVLLAVGDKVMLLQNDNELQLTNGQIGVITDITKNGGFRDKHIGHFSDSEIDLEELENGKFELEVEAEVEETKEQKAQREKDENQRQASHITTVSFPSVTGDPIEVKFATVGQYAKLAHAYAFTCHKSQGGEYRNVIIIFHSSHGRMLSREWFYTAVTRAQENCYVLCNMQGLNMALKNQAIKGVTLEQKANSFLAQVQAKEAVKPDLPPRAKLEKKDMMREMGV